MAYQIKLTVVDAPESVWRRIRIHGDVSPRVLNVAIRRAFGWDVMHDYTLGVRRPWDGPFEYVRKYRGVRVCELVGHDEALSFVYGGGDDWEVHARIEEMRPALKIFRPVCVGGGGTNLRARPDRPAWPRPDGEGPARLERIRSEAGDPIDVGAVTAALAGEPTKACPACRRRTTVLKRSECCGRMICGEGLKLCAHERHTLCHYHHAEGHAGNWKTCTVCRESFDVERYVYYGTNKYNLEVLENPPAFEPKHCVGCGRVIVLTRDSHEEGPDGYRCAECWED